MAKIGELEVYKQKFLGKFILQNEELAPESQMAALVGK